jgi:L-iditol 2-dehydrogenase
MKAAVYSGIGKIECREVEKPVIGDSEILIRVRAAAVCGTDLRIFKSGHFAIREGEERILGHEFCGEVAEVGSQVTRYKPGMRVDMAPNVGCGVCEFCRMGKVALCPEYIATGISFDGGFAEYFKVPVKAVLQGNLIPFGDSVTFEEMALAEPLSCCIKAYESVGTKPGDDVLIVGSGPMGALHLQVHRRAGARRIFIADIVESRLELLRRFKPDVVINTQRHDLVERMMEYTGGRGADVVITACPAPDVQQQAVEIAAKMGRINLFGGLPKGREHVPMNTNRIHYNSIIVTGTTGGTISQQERAVGLIEGGLIDTKSVISRKFDITKIREAFEFAMSGKGLKTVIVFD